MQISAGELAARIGRARELLASCTVCPRNCEVNRLEGEKGVCRAGARAAVSSYNLHFGEEPPISGYQGSGTIFFSHCNLKCLYCQNYPISQLGHGAEVSAEELARMMIKLQAAGAHNVNFVTPSHVVPQILEALGLAYEQGLEIPLVYNSSGYDSLQSLRLLDGIVDIYMPDMRYSSDQKAGEFSQVEDYVSVNRAAIREMHRQVGDLVMDEHGVAVRGLLIRHLVLPGGISGSEDIFRFIAEEISQGTYVSLMSQYFPAHKAVNHPVLHRRLTRDEFRRAREAFFKSGLSEGWVQSDP